SCGFDATPTIRRWTSLDRLRRAGVAAFRYAASPPASSALTCPTNDASSRAVSARARTRDGAIRISNPHAQVVVFCFRSTPLARLHRGQTMTPYIRHARNTSAARRSEEHTSELQSRFDLVCRL